LIHDSHIKLLTFTGNYFNMKVVADDKIPFLRGALESFADVVYVPGKEIDNETLKDADALLVRTRTHCTESLLKGTRVKFIGTATIGFDHIDTSYCERNNIHWTNAPGCNSSSVQQYLTAALFKISSGFGFELRGKTLGIIGVGNVGSKVERIARLSGMKVLLNDPPRARAEGEMNFVRLDTLLADSDIITVHVPLNSVGVDKTFHLFGREVFSLIKRGAWFINSSRGEVVDTGALKAALDSGTLGGAVTDVWEDEPDINLDLMSMVFIATPHIAGYSTDGKANGTAMVVNSLCNYFHLPLLNWYPDNVPDPEKPEIVIDCIGKSDEDIIRETVNHTYNISEDDMKLRYSPSDFERLRGDYPLRREFTSYKVRLIGGTDYLIKRIEGMGFKV